ncbi:MAG: hypothetical protein WC449_02615 [Candidatus Paceibacterota bacterium]
MAKAPVEYGENEEIFREIARIAVSAATDGFKAVFRISDDKAIGSVAASLIRAYPEELKEVAIKNFARK